MRNVGCIAVLALAAWSTPLQAQAQQVDDLRSRAEVLAESGDVEQAAALLREARNLAATIEDEEQRTQQLAIIGARIAELDPTDAVAAEQRRQAASLLLAAGRAYLARGWLVTALPLLQQAELIQPGIATVELVAAGVRPPESPAAVLTIGDYFAEAESYRDAWLITDDEIVSPALADHSLMLVTRQPLEGQRRVSVDTLLGTGPGKAALVFGHDRNWARQSFWFFEVCQLDSRTALRVFAHDGELGRMTTVCDVSVRRTAEQRTGWLTLTVELRGDRFMARFGEQLVGEFAADGPALPGAIGFYISSDSDQRAPVRFRNLRVEPL